MINLIPPGAKKSIRIEYWLRVLSSWFALWALTLVLGIAILVPAYVLISSQVEVYTAHAEQATEKILNFGNVTKELQQAGQQAGILIGGLNEPLVSDYILLFKELQDPGISLTSIGIRYTDKGVLGPASISGEAVDRQALAAFRERLLSQPEVVSVDLPISNLAKDKDIQFSMAVTIADKKAP